MPVPQKKSNPSPACGLVQTKKIPNQRGVKYTKGVWKWKNRALSWGKPCFENFPKYPENDEFSNTNVFTTNTKKIWEFFEGMILFQGPNPTSTLQNL